MHAILKTSRVGNGWDIELVGVTVEWLQFLIYPKARAKGPQHNSVRVLSLMVPVKHFGTRTRHARTLAAHSDLAMPFMVNRTQKVNP